MVTEDDVDKADRFFDVMAPRWCSSAGLLRGWKRGVDPGGGFGYGPAPLHCFHGGGLGGVERGPDRHRLCAGKQLAERSELHSLLRVRGVRVHGRERDLVHRAPPPRTHIAEWWIRVAVQPLTTTHM